MATSHKNKTPSRTSQLPAYELQNSDRPLPSGHVAEPGLFDQYITDLTVQDKRSNSGYQGYMTKTEYDLRQEQKLLDRQIRKYFDNWANSLSLDDLRQIKQIIIKSNPSYTEYFE